jgi:ParB family transcriptional regulator, chromosome partitioning protein
MRSSCRGNAGRVPTQRPKLAQTLSLDMTGYWRPTVRTYLGRITKARILEAVREAIDDEAADQIANMKKQGMAEAAEQLLAGPAGCQRCCERREPCRSLPRPRRRML